MSHFKAKMHQIRFLLGLHEGKGRERVGNGRGASEKGREKGK